MSTIRTWVKWALSCALTAIILLSFSLPTLAQGGFSIIVYPPEISEFPKITLFVDTYDTQGKFIPGLDLNSFTVLEDGLEIAVNETQLLEPGLHTIIAFNLGATLSKRANSKVPTRYETVVYDLASWLNGLQSSAANQYSLTSNEGILVEKLQEKDAFTFQLQNYKPNLYNFEPNLDSINLALDIAAKPNLIAHSKQSILYITPLPLDADLSAISTLEARAVETRVPVNVWLMAPDAASNSPAAIALNQLATSTGGKFFLYTEESTAPDIEEYLGVQRSVYRLRYTSTINQSGAHTIRVHAIYGNQETLSSEIPFSINLNLPSAVFIDLPDEINRQFLDSGNGRELQPKFITLQAKVVFPDGYSRQLEATRLYVDGKLISENTSEPFNFFAWPLEDYTFSGEHLVSVEVEDILGFRNISSPRSIRVNVESLYPSWLTAFLQFFNRGGWVLFAIFGLGGTISVSMRIRRKNQMRVPESETESAVDPLLQSIPGLSSSEFETASDAFETPAYRTSDDLVPSPYFRQIGTKPTIIKGKLKISENEQIIGSDPEQTSITLAHPSVSPRHARVQKNPSGNVTIADLHSNTGTWVNYTPISNAGTILKNGDLVKIGEFNFRYYLGMYEGKR
ncbi:MAG: FHA domain-containing protein [Anaerolineaceae bacterium]|nr:FHA domain-containing protein [Anaerolineaceae bacterium]